MGLIFGQNFPENDKRKSQKYFFLTRGIDAAETSYNKIIFIYVIFLNQSRYIKFVFTTKHNVSSDLNKDISSFSAFKIPIPLLQC